VLLCIDQDTDVRRFMLRAQEKGLSGVREYLIMYLQGAEYVYIVPDYVRFENQTDIWIDRTSEATSLSIDSGTTTGRRA